MSVLLALHILPSSRQQHLGRSSRPPAVTHRRPERPGPHSWFAMSLASGLGEEEMSNDLYSCI